MTLLQGSGWLLCQSKKSIAEDASTYRGVFCTLVYSHRYKDSPPCPTNIQLFELPLVAQPPGTGGMAAMALRGWITIMVQADRGVPVRFIANVHVAAINFPLVKHEGAKIGASQFVGFSP